MLFDGIVKIKYVLESVWIVVILYLVLEGFED